MYEARESKTLTQRIEKFVQSGEEKYGKGTYDYSLAKTEYSNNRTPVHLICNNPKCNKNTFKVYPFAHTCKGDNQKGTCPNCYVQTQTVQQTRWDPNLKERIKTFLQQMLLRHGERYSYPYIDKEYKNEYSKITVICNKCKNKPYTRLVSSLKDKNRYGGYEKCNHVLMVETIREKNRERQLRNHQTKDIPHDYGCIYQITNIKNGKFYIGYTTLSAKQRFKTHADETRRMQKGKRGRSSYLHNAMDYYGINSFKIEILKEYTHVTPYFLAELEMDYIAKMKPDYNISPGGEIGRSKKHVKSKK